MHRRKGSDSFVDPTMVIIPFSQPKYYFLGKKIITSPFVPSLVILSSSCHSHIGQEYRTKVLCSKTFDPQILKVGSRTQYGIALRVISSAQLRGGDKSHNLFVLFFFSVSLWMKVYVLFPMIGHNNCFPHDYLQKNKSFIL